MSSQFRLVLSLTASAVGACAPPPLDTPLPRPGGAESSQLPAPPPGTAEATDPPPAPDDAAPEAPPQFFRLAQAEHRLELVPLGDTLFVRGGGMPLALVEGDRVIEDERYGKGLEGFIGLRGLAGHFPDDAWALITLSNGRVGWGGLRRWNGRTWKVEGADLAQRWLYTGASPWIGGSLLTMSFNVMPFDTQQPVRFRRLGKVAKGALPLPSQSSCGTLVKASAFAALPSGEVFAAGATCDDDKFAIEWWRAGETRGNVERFDAPSPHNETYVLAGSPDHVWVIGDSWSARSVVHFDGTAWRELPHPLKHPVVSASLGPDGTLWVVSSQLHDSNNVVGGVFRRNRGGDWQEVPLPSGVRLPVSVHASAKEVWLTADTSLFRSSPPAGEPQPLRWEYGQQFPGALRIPKAATAGCQHVFVLMYGITRVTPKDYDFPLTRKAIAGHLDLAGAKFAETEDNGKRYFGAFVPTLAMGQKIEKLVRKQVKGSQPAVLCHQPRIVREIRLDLATGNVLP